MRRSLLIAATLIGLTRVAMAEDARPLKLEAVDQVVEKNDRAVQSCGSRARRDTLAVLMHLEIDPDGRVLTVAPSADKAPSEAACISRVVRRMKFPASGTVSHVEFPFLITPQLRR